MSIVSQCCNWPRLHTRTRTHAGRQLTPFTKRGLNNEALGFEKVHFAVSAQSVTCTVMIVVFATLSSLKAHDPTHNLKQPHSHADVVCLMIDHLTGLHSRCTPGTICPAHTATQSASSVLMIR